MGIHFKVCLYRIPYENVRNTYRLIRVLHEYFKTPVICFRVKRNPTDLENKIRNGEYFTAGEFGLHSSRWGFNGFHAFLRGNVERASEWPHSYVRGWGGGACFATGAEVWAALSLPREF